MSDVNLLRQKSDFFAEAKNGDSVIIYADRAIIFDMKADKIVNIGPLVKESVVPRGGVTLPVGEKGATSSAK